MDRLHLFSSGLTQRQAMEGLNYRIADHQLITITENDKNKLFKTRDAWRIHKDSISWLTKKLYDEEFLGKTIVVTHHGPSLLCQHELFGHTDLSGAFYSSLDNLVEKADLWVCGHTHSNLDTQVGMQMPINNKSAWISTRNL